MTKQRATARREQGGLTQPSKYPRGSIEDHLDRTIDSYGELGKNVAYVGAGAIPGAIAGAGFYGVALDPIWREYGAPWVDKATELARDYEELKAALKDSASLEEVRISEFLEEYYAGVEPINAQEEELLSEFLDTIAKFQTPEWQLEVFFDEAGYFASTGADWVMDLIEEKGEWTKTTRDIACWAGAGKATEELTGFDLCDNADRELAKTYYTTLHQLHENIETAMEARQDLTLAIEAHQKALEISGEDLGIYALDVNDINGMGGLDIVLESENSQLIEMKHSLLALDRIIIDQTTKHEEIKDEYETIIDLSREDLGTLESYTGRDYSAELEQLHKETMEMTEALDKFADERVEIYTGVEYNFKQKSLMGQYESVIGESIQEEGTVLFGTASGLMGLTAGLFVASSLRSAVRKKHGCGLLKFIFYEGPKNTLKFPLVDGPISTINAIGETIGLAANTAYEAGKELYTAITTPNQPK